MSKSIYSISKEVALIVFGALIGIIAIPFGSQISNGLPYFLFALILLVLYGLGLLEVLIKLCYMLVKKINNKLGIVCIYAPYEIGPGNSSWVNVNLKDLEQFLRNKKIKSIRGKTTKVFKEYPIIINPYGGAYPESEISHLNSLSQIFHYVRDGGIYVNIADIPFYYAYDHNLKRRVDTTPLAGDFSLDRSFLKTILTKKLNHHVFGLTRGEDFKSGVKRIIQLSETSENLFGKDTFVDGQGGYSPVLKIPYGRGYFIFSTLQITEDNLESNLLRILKQERIN